jgi:thioredoxin reductase
MDSYDVVVVGGGAAGLSAALMLARARRSVLVVDAGEPRNAPAAGVHGFLSRDGISPAELTRIARDEVRGYGGHVVDGRAVAGARDGDGFAVTLGDGSVVGCRKLLVTTGLVDELPDVPGVRERWGRDVLHCPYCHGWENRDQAIGILATGPFAVHQALMFRQWTPDVILLVHTQPDPDEADAERLDARGIRTALGEVTALEVHEDRLTGARLRDGRVIPLQALVVAPRFTARSDFLATLGLEPTPHPQGAFIAADPSGLTAVPGVWVAGNVSDLRAQVLAAAAGGAAAAVAINTELIEEDTESAVTARRERDRLPA